MADSASMKAFEEYKKAMYAVMEAEKKFNYTLDGVNSCANGGFYLDEKGKPNRAYMKWLKAHESNKKVLAKAREKFLKVCKKYCINPNTPFYEVKQSFYGVPY